MIGFLGGTGPEGRGLAGYGVADEDQLPDWARQALERFLYTGQGFENPRLISEVVTVERLITSRLGFDAD